MGCGDGPLAQRLAPYCEQAIAIDVNSEAIARARSLIGSDARITLVEGDAMTESFQDASFDLIPAVASLHHLPLERALTRFRKLLVPGGVLVVVGLHVPRTLVDDTVSAVAFPVSWMFQSLYGHAPVAVLVRDPTETLRQIKTISSVLLPGAAVRRHLLFRYSLIWRRPPDLHLTPNTSTFDLTFDL